jgi:beta-galactosidase
VADACILFTHDNDWTLQQPMQPNKFFNLREHIQLIYNAIHDRNISVDFAQPTEDLSQYKIVFAPSLHLLSAGEADRLKLYVQNGGTLVGTFNTGLVNAHCIVPDTGYPNDMTDMFGLEVLEFDPIPPGEENHLTFKGAFPTSHLHPARLWCDIIEPKGCQILATYAKDFYSGRPAITMNNFGLGKAIYIGTMSHQHFYNDLVSWLRQMCNLHPLLKVPENVEVSMRQKEGMRVFFLLNHQNSPVRIQFYKPMHDFLTGNTFSGNYDIPPHGVLVLDEHPEDKISGAAA